MNSTCLWSTARLVKKSRNIFWLPDHLDFTKIKQMNQYEFGTKLAELIMKIIFI